MRTSKASGDTPGPEESGAHRRGPRRQASGIRYPQGTLLAHTREGRKEGFFPGRDLPSHNVPVGEHHGHLGEERLPQAAPSVPAGLHGTHAGAGSRRRKWKCRPSTFRWDSGGQARSTVYGEHRTCHLDLSRPPVTAATAVTTHRCTCLIQPAHLQPQQQAADAAFQYQRACARSTRGVQRHPEVRPGNGEASGRDSGCR